LIVGCFLMPGEEFREPLDRMIGDAGEDVVQIGLGVEAIEFRGLDQRVHRRGALAATVRAGEDPIFSAQSNHAVIVPISGKKLRSITAGTRGMGAGFGDNMSSGVPSVKLFTSRWLPATSWS